MVAGAAADPALEQLGDAGIEALGPGAELRGQVAGEDGRQLVAISQDDQVRVLGRFVEFYTLRKGCQRHARLIFQGVCAFGARYRKSGAHSGFACFFFGCVRFPEMLEKQG